MLMKNRKKKVLGYFALRHCIVAEEGPLYFI